MWEQNGRTNTKVHEEGDEHARLPAWSAIVPVGYLEVEAYEKSGKFRNAIIKDLEATYVLAMNFEEVVLAGQPALPIKDQKKDAEETLLRASRRELCRVYLS